MVNRVYKKGLVVGIIILFIAVSFAPSINANIDRTPVKNKLVETSVRIHRARGITPYTLKLTEKESDEIDRIFDNLKEKLADVDTKDEVNIIFKEALIELDKYGVLGELSASDVFKIISSGDNDSYSVFGESYLTPGTYFFERLGRLLYESSSGFLEMFILWFFLEKRDAFFQMDSWIIFGELYYYERQLEWDTPAEGYLKIISSDGENEYAGSFYGQLENIVQYDYFNAFYRWEYCVGIKGFKGLKIGDYYFGTAKEVNVDYYIPNL